MSLGLKGLKKATFGIGRVEKGNTFQKVCLFIRNMLLQLLEVAEVLPSFVPNF